MGGCPQAGTWIYCPWHLYSLSIRIAVYRSSLPPQGAEATLPGGAEAASPRVEGTPFRPRLGRRFAIIRTVHDLGHGYWQLSRNGN